MNSPTGMARRKKQDGELVNCYSDLNHRDFSSVAETNSATLFYQKSEKLIVPYIYRMFNKNSNVYGLRLYQSKQ